MASIVKIPFRCISVQLVFEENPANTRQAIAQGATISPNATVYSPNAQRWAFDMPEIYAYLVSRCIRETTFITTTEDKSFALRFEDDAEAVVFRLKYPC